MDLLTPAGQGPTRLDRLPAASRQDDPSAAHQPRNLHELPGVKLIVLLIDERPEEVTDMKGAVKGEVVASSLDRGRRKPRPALGNW